MDATFRWENCYGYDYLYAGPLFIHQLSHVWIDFRGVQDAFMRSKASDYSRTPAAPPSSVSVTPSKIRVDSRVTANTARASPQARVLGLPRSS